MRASIFSCLTGISPFHPIPQSRHHFCERQMRTLRRECLYSIILLTEVLPLGGKP